MKLTAVLTFVVAATALLAADPAAAPPPQLPRQAPDLAIQLPGKQIRLSQYDGYIRVVAFMATTCPHCQHLTQVLSVLQQEYAPKGVQMIGVAINAEANAELPNFTAVFARNLFPIGLSVEPIVRNFLQHPPGIPYFPMIAFIDKKGVIRSQHLGANDAAFFKEDVEVQNLRAEIDKIIAQPTIQLPAVKKK